MMSIKGELYKGELWDLEIYLCSIVGADEKLFHLLRCDGSGVGACAGVAQPAFTAISATLDLNSASSMPNSFKVDGIFKVRLNSLIFSAESVYLGFLRGSAKAYSSGNVCIAAFCFRLMGIVFDHIGQVDGVGTSVGDMACGEGCASSCGPWNVRYLRGHWRTPGLQDTGHSASALWHPGCRYRRPKEIQYHFDGLDG